VLGFEGEREGNMRYIMHEGIKLQSNELAFGVGMGLATSLEARLCSISAINCYSGSGAGTVLGLLS